MNKEKIKEVMTDTFVKLKDKNEAEVFLDFLNEQGFDWVDGDPLEERGFITAFGLSLHDLMYRYRNPDFMETDGISLLLTNDEIEEGERIITFKEFLSELTGFSFGEEVVPVYYSDIKDSKTDHYFGSNEDMVDYMDKETRGTVKSFGMNPTALVPYVVVEFQDGNMVFYHPKDLNGILDIKEIDDFIKDEKFPMVSDFFYGEMVKLKSTNMLGDHIDAKEGDVVVVVGHNNDFVVVIGYNWEDTQVVLPYKIEKLTE